MAPVEPPGLMWRFSLEMAFQPQERAWLALSWICEGPMAPLRRKRAGVCSTTQILMTVVSNQLKTQGKSCRNGQEDCVDVLREPCAG